MKKQCLDSTQVGVWTNFLNENLDNANYFFISANWTTDEFNFVKIADLSDGEIDRCKQEFGNEFLIAFRGVLDNSHLQRFKELRTVGHRNGVDIHALAPNGNSFQSARNVLKYPLRS